MLTSKKTCIIIGSGNLAVYCTDHLLSNDVYILAAVSVDEVFYDYLIEKNITAIAYSQLETFLSENDTDYIFSIVNPHLLSYDVVSKAKIACINFHDSLLPKYAGAFATTWSIINDEKHHGITWHHVTELFDAGDIVIQGECEIEINETTSSLNAKCFEQGKLKFVELTDFILSGNIPRISQDKTKRTYNLFRIPPPNYGYINWNKNKDNISRLCRALDFGAYENNFGTLKIAVGNAYYIPVEWEIVERVVEGAEPGTLLESNGGVEIALIDGVFCLNKLMTVSGEVYPTEVIFGKHSVHIGDKLPLIDSSIAEIKLKNDETILVNYNKTDNNNNDYYYRLEDLFIRSVNKYPKNIALQYSNKSITYEQLDLMSNALAKNIFSRLKCKEDGIVAIMIGKSWLQIVAIIAILKLGKTYLPLSTEDPTKRIENIFNKSDAKLLITEQGCERTLAIDDELIYAIHDRSFEVCNTSHLIPHNKDYSDIAYIIYTSGSTGEPKGVAMSHMSAINTIIDINIKYNVNAKDKILGLSKLNFDLSVYDIFGILAAGGCLVIPTEIELRDPKAWLDLIDSNKITIWNSVPALIDLFLKACSVSQRHAFESLRCVLLSGDWIAPRLARDILKLTDRNKTQIISLGGATEGGIWSIYHPIVYAECTWRSIPYGRPLSNQHIYILDSLLRIQPVNSIGEICIGGKSIARYYHNDSELTQKKFVFHPVLGNIYKTGDLGLLGNDGNIEILGRKDTQIKINGLRIEAKEIEYWICQFDSNIQAKVLVTKGNHPTLVAFLITGSEDNTRSLKQYLLSYLPLYMVPQQYINVNSWPLTHNGKIDTDMLLTQARSTRPLPQINQGFSSSLSRELKLIWMKVLNLTAIPNDDDNFFYLGGNSLTSISLTREINNAGYRFSNEMVFRFPTIKQITNKLSEANNSKATNTFEYHVYTPTPTQLGIISDSLLDPENNVYVEQITWKTIGNIDPKIYKRAWKELARCTDTLQLKFMNNHDINVRFCQLDDINYDYIDVSNDRCIDNSIIRRISDIDLQNRFDLFDGILYRISFIKLNDLHYITVFTFFHALLDGISLSLLLNRFHKIYDALASHKPLELRQPGLPFKEYLKWIGTYKSLSDMDFWRSYIKGSELSYLPFYKSQKSYSRDYICKNLVHELRNIPESTLKRLTDTAKEACITVPSLMQGIWSFILTYCTSKESVISGLAISGRNTNSDFTETIGFLLNVIPLKSPTFNQSTLEDYCKHIHVHMNEASSHGTLGLPEIQQIAGDNNPLFDHILIFNNEISINTTEYKVSEFNYRERTNYPLTITYELGSSCKIKFSYDEEYIEAEGLIEVIDWYTSIISRLDSIWSDKLSNLEVNHKLPSFAHVGDESLVNRNIFNSIEESSYRYPNKKCIEMSDGSFITYNALINNIYRISTSLRKSLDPIIIFLPRNIELITVILACLQIGRPYVPISLDTPTKRILKLAKEANIVTIITNKQFYEHFGDMCIITIENIQDNLPNITSNKLPQLSAIYFTSGSTGSPKAVEIKHTSLINCLQSFNRLWDINCDDKFLALTPISFDISQIELLLPLINGASIYLCSDNEYLDPKSVIELIHRSKPTILQTTPSIWSHLLDSGLIKSTIRKYISGGEALTPAIARRLLALDPEQLWNVYGPTEATIWCTAKKINEEDDAYSIGSPIDNTICLVLNKFMQPLPAGCNGELYIAGAGVANRYLNVENDDSFHKLKIDNDVIFYKSGDFVKYINGEFYFSGRKDRQVKIRGQRIELGEIEAAIRSIHSIEDVKVLYDGKDISAFCVRKKRLHSKIKYSLLYFTYSLNESPEGYGFITQSARLADQLKFDALWIPERHFNPMGGLFPNPAVLASNLAAITSEIHIRAGSVVLPLHEPINIAEDWSMIDNLSNGRTGVSFATGWHPNDFALAPERFIRRKELFVEQIKTVQKLWSGGSVPRINGNGDEIDVAIFPLPRQEYIPIWITAAGSEETFRLAGAIGANILTHLLIHDTEELSKKIEVYKKSLVDNGFNPDTKTITAMIHTFISRNHEDALHIADLPFKRYMKQHFSLFELMTGEHSDSEYNSDDSHITILAERFIKNTLIGSVEHCKSIVNHLLNIGVTEIACLVDFGITSDIVLESLPLIKEVCSPELSSFVDANSIIDELAANLTPSMIPASISFIDELPLTQHGKCSETLLFAMKKCENQQGDIPSFPAIKDEKPTITDNTIRVLRSIFCKSLNRTNITNDISFFNMGGHSLKALSVVKSIEDQLDFKILLRDFFQNATINKLAAFIARKRQNAVSTDMYINEFSLSFGQEALWTLHQIDPNSARYNDSFVISFKAGAINKTILEESIHSTCMKHPLLTAKIKSKYNEILQVIPYRPKISFEDISIDGVFDNSYNKIKEIANQPFEIYKSMARFTFIRFSDRDILIISIHHLITDGKSFVNFINTLNEFYKKRINRSEMDFDEIEIIQRHITNERSKAIGRESSYLCSQLKTLSPICYKHISRRPLKIGSNGFTIQRSCSTSMQNIIYNITNNYNCTIFTYFFSVLTIVMRKFSDDESFAIGWPYANRDNPDHDNILFPLVNLLVTPIKVNQHHSFIEHLEYINESIVETFTHKDLPFSKLVEMTNIDRSLSCHPIFQIAINSVDITQLATEFDGNTFDLHMHDFGISRYDLEMQVIKNHDKLDLRFIFNSDIFPVKIAEEFLSCFEGVLSSISDNPSALLSNVLCMCTEANLSNETLSIISDKYDIRFELDENDSSRVHVYYNREGNLAKQKEIILNWAYIYNKLYMNDSTLYAGWINSTTMLPYTKDEMDEWASETIRQIECLNPRKIVEIGAGSGLLIDALLDNSDAYYAIDISTAALDHLSKRYPDKLTCIQAEAIELPKLNLDDTFDLVILNSVVQYFPDINYFLDVIACSSRLVKKGQIFIGDIINFDLLFESCVSNVDKNKLLSSNELYLSPCILYSLKHYIPSITEISIQNKSGIYDTEMNKYRYNCILSIDHEQVAVHNTTPINISEQYLGNILSNINKIDYMKNYHFTLEPVGGETKAHCNQSKEKQDIKLKLVNIWESILGVTIPDTEMTFFELGGNSISSIQMVLRSRQQGIAISPQEFYENQTIDSLIELILNRHSSSSPSSLQIDTTSFPLSPIQNWLITQRLANINHWNQSFLINIRKRLNFNSIKMQLTKLLNHYDIFKLRFDESLTMQHYVCEVDHDISHIDLSHINDQDETVRTMLSHVDELQRGLHISQGKLYKIVLFELGVKGQRLLLIFHNLIMDGVSWRIYLDDLSYILNNPEYALSPTSSYKDWVISLISFIHSDASKQSVTFWRKKSKELSRVKSIFDFDRNQNLYRNQKQQRLIISKCNLSHQVNENILLASFVHAYQQVYNTDNVYIDIESHGRQIFDRTINLSRTLGWFTTIYPILFTLNANLSFNEILSLVTSQMNEHSNTGHCLMAIKSFCTDPVVINEVSLIKKPDIVFNYLGELAQTFQNHDSFEIATEEIGLYHDERNTRPYLLHINISNFSSEVIIELRYNDNLFEENTINDILEVMNNSLTNNITRQVEEKV